MIAYDIRVNKLETPTIEGSELLRVKGHSASDAMQRGLEMRPGCIFVKCSYGVQCAESDQGYVEFEIPKHEPLTHSPAPKRRKCRAAEMEF